MNKLREILFPTPEQAKAQKERFLAVIKEWAKDKVKDRGCITCKHCIHVINYPGFVTGEECECDIGLECDTILDSVTNCEKWEECIWEELSTTTHLKVRGLRLPCSSLQ